MPNRKLKAGPDLQGRLPPGIHLEGLREAIREALHKKKWKVADLVRATGIDDGYMRRMMKGAVRFNEEHLSNIFQTLDLPFHVGEIPPMKIHVEMHPPTPHDKKGPRPENIPIPLLPASIVARKPFSYAPREVLEYAYINWRAFQAFRPESMVCVKISMETDAPFVRKDAILCIAMDVQPPTKNVPEAAVWGARKSGGIVIGHLQEEAGATFLIRKIPAPKTEAISGRQDIVGRVCWVWHSLV